MDYEKLQQDFRNEIADASEKLRDGPPYFADGEEVDEDLFLKLIVARAALLATLGMYIETGESPPPSIWIGEIAGTVLSSEMEIQFEEIANYMVERARQARDN